MQYLFLAMSSWLGHCSPSHLQPAQTPSLLRAELALAKLCLLFLTWRPRRSIAGVAGSPLALGVGCGPHMRQERRPTSHGVQGGGEIIRRLSGGEVEPVGPLGAWLAVQCGALGLLLQGNWGYQFSSSSLSRTCNMEHAPLPQPSQRKVRALGFKTTLISSFS